MSDDRLTQLARDVAAVAPVERNKTSSTAKVPWALINALREELDARGVDWRERHNEIGDSKWRQ